MKIKYLLFVVATLLVESVMAQKIEKNVVATTRTVVVPLGVTEGNQLNGLDEARTFTFIQGRLAAGALSPGSVFNPQTTIGSLKDAAIIVFTNVNPQYTAKIADLNSIRAAIDGYTSTITTEFSKLSTITSIKDATADEINSLLTAEIKTLKLQGEWSTYHDIKSEIFRSLGTTDDAVIANVKAAVEGAQEARAFLIKNFEELHQLVYRPSETQETIILHSSDGVTWDDDITGCRTILVVTIDINGNLKTSTFLTELFTSAVIEELRDFGKLVKDLKIFTLASSGPTPLPSMDATVNLMELRRSKVNPPANVVGIFKGHDDKGVVKNDTVRVKVREKIHLGFRVGVSSALVERKLFKIDNKQLVISLDSAKKEEWKQHLMCTFNVNPWYRTGDYSPKMFKYDDDNKFKNRISLFTGFNLSVKPLDNIYLGLAYDLSKDFTVNFGTTWNNVNESRAIDIGDVTSLQDAIKLSNKSYDKGKIFFALTFRPAVISELLGLGDDEE